MIDTKAMAEIKPRFLRRENGGWLAVTPLDAPVRIGVEAWSVDDARDRFGRALREWVKLLELPTPNPEER